jgi:hypothetical protein
MYLAISHRAKRETTREAIHIDYPRLDSSVVEHLAYILLGSIPSLAIFRLQQRFYSHVEGPASITGSQNGGVLRLFKYLGIHHDLHQLLDVHFPTEAAGTEFTILGETFTPPSPPEIPGRRHRIWDHGTTLKAVDNRKGLGRPETLTRVPVTQAD